MGKEGTMVKRKVLVKPDPWETGEEKGLGIAVVWQNDGGTYSLPPQTFLRIQDEFPDALMNRHIFIGYDKTKDWNRFQRPVWPTLVQLLTGLTPRQIAQLDGAYIYDMDAEKVLWRWDPAVNGH
jgi:hypothetical protein